MPLAPPLTPQSQHTRHCHTPTTVNALAACFGTRHAAHRATGPLDKPLVRVYLLDNSMKSLLVEDTSTALDVATLVCEKIGIEKPEDVVHCFGLCECKDGVTIERPLPDASEVVQVIRDWGENTTSRFVFTTKLYMHHTILGSADPKIEYMLYIQAVYNVISGIYPTTPDQAVQLAALQLLAKHGPHKPEVHKVGYLSHQLIGFIPHSVLGVRRASQWEEEIFEAHAALTFTKDEARVEYCRILSERDYYGCAFFMVAQSFSRRLPKTLMIGISCKGIYVLERNDKVVLQKYRLSDIYRWGFKPETSFYFELKSPAGSGPVYEFRTEQGHSMSDLLTEYAMALLKEMGLAGGAADAAKGAGGDGADGAAGGGADSGGADGGAKADASEEDKAGAATRLQSAFRGYRLRRDLEYEYAAVRVQSVFRGYKERCRMDAMIAEMEAELEEAELEEGA